MVIYHLCGSIEPNVGGPAQCIPNLCDALRSRVDKVELIVLRGSGEQRVYADHKSFIPSIPKKLGHSPKMWRWLVESIKKTKPDILHSHSLWSMPSIYPGILSLRFKIPHIVSPHGCLTRYSMANGSHIKSIYWPLIQKPVLKQAAAFHATAESELEDIRRLGFRQPIAIIPNGLEIPPLIKNPATNIHLKTVLYFGRYHPEKGLLNLLQAWSIVSPAYPDWRLLLVGIDSVGYRAELEKFVFDANIPNVTFEGPQYGLERFKVYRRGSISILPSPSENFGITVAESLSMGVPVIATTGSPWARLELHQCGWWVDYGVRQFVDVLKQAMIKSPLEMQAMGERGRAWIQGPEFSWPEISRRMFEFYQFVLGKQPKPTFVDTV
jgi:glycosyltransferase involved in cell wall biosynthesis